MALASKDDENMYIYEYGIDINSGQAFFHSYKCRELPNEKLGLLDDKGMVVKRIRKSELDLFMDTLGFHHNRRLFYTLNPDIHYMKDNLKYYLNTLKSNAQRTIDEKEKKIIAIDKVLDILDCTEV